jgi:hypothetical protein
VNLSPEVSERSFEEAIECGLLQHGSDASIVPRGVEHCPRALTDEVHVVLLEPKTTVNTGNLRNERTAADQWI